MIADEQDIVKFGTFGYLKGIRPSAKQEPFHYYPANLSIDPLDHCMYIEEA